MPRLALFNMAFGFCVLAVVAAAGAFIATDMTHGYLKDPGVLDDWWLTIAKSSHGHTNLFGLIHIAFGLTLPYSPWRVSIKKLQTIGIMLGTLGMGPLLLLKGYQGPSDQLNALEILTGLSLSAALVAIASHALGLALKFGKRAS